MLQKLHHALTGCDAIGGRLVEVLRELHECLQIAELCKLKLDAAGHALHCLGLCRGAYARDGDAHIDSRTYAFVEEVGHQKDLSVSDGDDIGRDVAGDVAILCLDDGKRGDRAAALFFGESARALKEPRV